MKNMILKNKERIGVIIITLILSFICSFKVNQLNEKEINYVNNYELQTL